MNRLLTPHGTFGQTVLMMVFALFLCRALVPLGFMPGQGDAAGTMVICSGLSEKVIGVDADGNPVRGKSAESPCAFSINTAGLETPALIIALVPPVVVQAEMPQARHNLRVNLPYESRGPPAFLKTV